MAVSAVSGFRPLVPLTPPAPVAGTDAAASTGGTDFGKALSQGLENVQKAQSDADNLAVKAATGDLQDVHDYTIAAAQASLATQMTVTMRNKAVEAFNEILRMPL